MTSLPDNSLIRWVNSLSTEVRQILLRRFIFMSSNNSDDFALTAEECDEYFHHHVYKIDFPLRRVARLLTVRALFDYLLNQCHFNVLLDDENTNIIPIINAHWYQAQQSWNNLCAGDLSDAAVNNWLQQLQDQN